MKRSNTGEAKVRSSVTQETLFFACLQDTSAAGVKRAKLESWEKSVGTLGGRGARGSLVVRKKAATGNKPVVQSTSSASTSQTGNNSHLLLLI